jgi:hypothetical protein
MHAILAFTSLHMRALQARVFLRTSKYEEVHTQQALALFRQSISISISEADADAILATATLINGITFLNIQEKPPEECWPFVDSSSEDDLLWLRLQSGIGLVFSRTFGQLQKGRFRDLFIDKKTGSEKITPRSPTAKIGKRAKREGQIECFSHNLTELCGIGSDNVYLAKAGTRQNANPYAAQLCILAPLLQETPTTVHVFEYLGFVGYMSQPYLEMLRAKDHLALLVLAVWYLKLEAVDCWWTKKRAKFDRIVIGLYLERYADVQIRSTWKSARRLFEIPEISSLTKNQLPQQQPLWSRWQSSRDGATNAKAFDLQYTPASLSQGMRLAMECRDGTMSGQVVYPIPSG